MSPDSNKSILTSALKFCSGTAFSRISGFLRDFSMAYFFGATPQVAIFFVAYRLSYLFRRLFSDGAMQSAFIPLFEEKRKKEGQEAATLFFSTLKRAMTSILILFILLSTGILWLFFGGEGESLELTTLTIWMLPSLLFLTLFGVNAAHMQCDKRFFLPAFAPVVFNLVWIGGALLYHDLPQEEAMRRLAIMMNLGSLLQWLITLPFSRTNVKGSWKFWSPDIRRLVQKMGLGFTGVAAIQVNNAIDPLFALVADPEGPTFLWYAIRLKQVPLALFGIAISSALLPPLARAIHDGDSRRFKQFFHDVIAKSSFLMIPITFFTCIAATPIIDSVFGYGEFTHDAVLQTSTVLICYILGLVPATFILIQAQVYFALGDFRTPAKGAILAMVTNTALNTVLIYGMGWGAASVALATSISSLFNALFLFSRLPVEKPSMAFPLLQAGVSSSFGALVTTGIASWTGVPSQSVWILVYLSTLFGTTYLLATTFMNRLAKQPKAIEE